MTRLISELDHRLSVVKRWNILHTIQHQTVAEHCFNVARLAAKIWPLLGGRADMLVDVYEWALHHDDEEALANDPPAMIKPYFDMERFKADHKDLIGSYRPANTDVKLCVKLADKIEGLHFLWMEVNLGNQFAAGHLQQEFVIIMKWARENYDTETCMLIQSWLVPFKTPGQSTRFARAGV